MVVCRQLFISVFVLVELLMTITIDSVNNLHY